MDQEYDSESLKMFSGVQSPEGFTGAGNSASELVLLLAAGLGSSLSRPPSLLGCLSVLTTWPLAPPRVSGPRESTVQAAVPVVTSP